MADQKLRDVYASALKRALDHDHRSLAFGSISTGGNGISGNLAAQIAAEEIRTTLAQLGPRGNLRITVVAFEEEIEHAFTSAIDEVRQHPNQNLVELLPLLPLDSMLPRQRLRFSGRHTEHDRFAFDTEHDRFAMVGTTRHGRILPFGVAVNVRERFSAQGTVQLEVVGGQRFVLPGDPFRDTDRPRPEMWASVKWINEEPEDLTPAVLQCSKELDALVKRWLLLVRSGHERQPGQMGLILEHLGPMPPAESGSDRAFWVAALINPLPALGVAFEIRAAVLAATSAADRLKIVDRALRESVAGLE